MNEEHYDPDHWRSKKGILAAANNGQTITNIECLLELSRSAQDSALGFKNLGMEREARICQLKSEMFKARAEDLSQPTFRDVEELLSRIADKLEDWADQSKNGGWSTHQVEPQRKLAAQIRNAIMTGRYNNVLQERK